MSGQIHTAAGLPTGKEPQVPIGQEAGLSSGKVWTRSRTEKFSAPTRNGSPVVEPVS
jgi:hypothetical protein